MAQYDVRGILNFANLSNLSYNQDTTIGMSSATDYHVVATQYNASTGFGAQASYNAATNTLAIAYAGTTVTSVPDLVTDYQMTRYAGWTMQDHLATSFTQQALASQRMLAINTTVNAATYVPPSVVFTGHSLGGELAQQQAVQNPGSHQWCLTHQVSTEQWAP